MHACIGEKKKLYESVQDGHVTLMVGHSFICPRKSMNLLSKIAIHQNYGNDLWDVYDHYYYAGILQCNGLDGYKSSMVQILVDNRSLILNPHMYLVLWHM